MNRYTAFGLTLETPLCFPELAGSRSRNSDVRIVPGDVAAAPENEQCLQFAVDTLGRFEVRDGSRITYPAGAREDMTRLFVLGSAMGALLQQRDLVVLHGNALSPDEETCRIVVGHPGAGKSTAAAWAYLQGERVLADDVCAIRFTPSGEAVVVPSFPQIKLWQTSLDLLDISSTALRRIRTEDEKFALPLADRFVHKPCRLTEVQEIKPDSTNTETIRGVEKIKLLVEHSYRYHFIKRMGREKSYHRLLLQLAGAVKARRVPREVIPRRPEAHLAYVPTTV